jgi:hypothetical protein
MACDAVYSGEILEMFQKESAIIRENVSWDNLYRYSQTYHVSEVELLKRK